MAVAAPVNGTVEVAGPEQFCLDELNRCRLGADNDQRHVITDQTLLPDDGAALGTIHLSDWLAESHDAT